MNYGRIKIIQKTGLTRNISKSRLSRIQASLLLISSDLLIFKVLVIIIIRICLKTRVRRLKQKIWNCLIIDFFIHNFDKLRNESIEAFQKVVIYKTELKIGKMHFASKDRAKKLYNWLLKQKSMSYNVFMIPYCTGRQEYLFTNKFCLE